MSWDFQTDPDFQTDLDWADEFVRSKVEILDLEYPHEHYTPPSGQLADIVARLKDEVRRHGLWATHLGPELGGAGFGQVKLALLNEILGRSWWAPTIFGTQAPDSGNAEILAHYGTPDQQRRFLDPLLQGEAFSCFSMTEPQGGSDPGQFTTRAWREGDEWVLEGRKFFSSNATTAAFFLVLAVTEPEAPVRSRMSIFLVPAETDGVVIERRTGLGGEPLDAGSHPLVRYDRVRLPADSLLGPRGGGFVVAQTRLGGGRVHHAMRTVGLCQRALDMMAERALSRETKGELLAQKGSVQDYIANSWIAIQQLRLLVLHTAWCVDQSDTASCRKEIAAAKVAAADTLHEVVTRAIHVHGALGISNELPLWEWLRQVFVVRFSDGPSEIHRQTITRLLLRDYEPVDGLWPSEHIPSRLARRRAYEGVRR